MKKLIMLNLVVSLVMVTAVIGFAEPGESAAEAFQTRLQNLAETTQAQIGALSEQVAITKDAAESEKLAAQVMEIKRQGEIDRLQILLEWAEAEGDEARIAEIQEALYNWQNPVENTNLPEISKEKNIAPSQSVKTEQ